MSCHVASCRIVSRRVTSSVLVVCITPVVSRRVTLCRVVISHVMSRVMSFLLMPRRRLVYDLRALRGQGSPQERHQRRQEDDLRQGGGVKAQPAKMRRNKNRGQVAKRRAGAKGRARLLCVSCPIGFSILETSATGSPGYYLVYLKFMS